ncbi:MAG: tetratricopeptide repeat protein [Spartobacteria bacterium]|nr:tetratricopeptide repeat protein [Spartobacteria bacterium]
MNTSINHMEHDSTVIRKMLKKFLLRLLMAITGPILFLLLLEGGLRLAGYGHPTSFLLSRVMEGKNVYIDNQFFGYRFFPKDLSRTPAPIRAAAEAGSNCTRIVLLGESAAMGEPTPEIGLAPVLTTLLTSACPSAEFEVINAAMTAVNSHVLREIATSVTVLKPDICVLYMGNNEVVGPYGPGTVFDAFSAWPSFNRLRVMLGRFRFSQLIRQLVRHIRSGSADWAQWQGMEMFMTNTVAASDPRMSAVYTQFADNLKAIAHTLSASGARVVLCTVAANLYDQEPFAPPVTDASGFAAAREAARRGEGPYALFSSIRDEDQLRFRADSTMNAILRDCARDSPHALTLFDAEAVASANAAHGIPGDDLFWDHVHLHPFGTYVLASNLVARLADAGMTPCDSLSAIPSYTQCMRQLSWSAWSEAEGAQTIARRLQQPPFPDTPRNRTRVARLLDGQAALRAEGRRQLISHLQTHPKQPGHIESQHAAMENTEMGRIYVDIDAYDDAVQSLTPAVGYWPHRYDLRGYLSLALAFQTNTTEAIRVLRAIPAFDEDMAIKQLLGNARVLRKHHAAYSALFLLQDALEMAPEHPALQYEMTLCYAANGNVEKANALFRRLAATPGPYQWDAKLEWALFLTKQDRWPEAQKRFLELMTEHPEPATARLHYAVALRYAGHTSDARAELESLCRRHPDFTEARRQLEKLNTRSWHEDTSFDLVK